MVAICTLAMMAFFTFPQGMPPIRSRLMAKTQARILVTY